MRVARRVVTGHDDSGKAVVLFDGAAPNVKVRKAAGGIVSTLLWVTEESPPSISASSDRSDREIGVAPPDGGTIFRIVDFPPAGDSASIDSEAFLREMGLGHGGAPGRNPFTHRTRTVDYAVVISGEIDMLLDDSEIHLKAGDVLVQQGTNHAWVNRGEDTCRIAFVLIDAEEPPAGRMG